MKKIRLYIILLVSLFSKWSLFAQQDPLFSLYMYDKMLINPAFTGSSNWAVGTIKYRSQFSGFTGNPKTQTLNFHTPIQVKHLGLGFKIVNDKLAILSTQNITADVSYHLNLLGGKFSFGIEAGILSRKTDYQKVIVSTLGDNALTELNQKAVSPDLSWGLFYQKKEFYFGFSQYHLIYSPIGQNKTPYNGLKYTGNYYITSGKVFDINKLFNVEPSVLLKLQGGSKPQLDLNLITTYNNMASVGLQYRTDKSINLSAKFSITQNLKIVYSYDHNLNQLSGYTSGSHEILVSYGIKLPPPPTRKEIHPRYYF